MLEQNDELRRSIEKQLSETSDMARLECIEKLSLLQGGALSQFVEKVLVRVLMHDHNAIVRHEAAFVLGRLHANGVILGNFALDALCKSARRDPSIVVRHEAAESLGYFADLAAMDALLQLMRDNNADLSATAELALQRQRFTSERQQVAGTNTQREDV